jgi:hypothetical protein
MAERMQGGRLAARAIAAHGVDAAGRGAALLLRPAP